MMNKHLIALITLSSAVLLCCGVFLFAASPGADSSRTAAERRMVAQIFADLRLPPQLLPDEKSIDAFIAEINALIAADSEQLLVLVDKKHFLSETYEPSDLVPLKSNANYTVNRADLSLRRSAEAALSQMGAAAKKDGITLLASSSYRSFSYQKGVYERNVRQMGKEAADRESAMPGASQHQLGTVVDFGSITDDFAQTRAGIWVNAHAGEYGFSISFPQGFEEITGYRWESWHFRYIGKNAAACQNRWFDGIQQYLLEFLHEWKLRNS